MNEMMKNEYRFFKRDISWLSFNFRVLMEAEDKQLPIYERINFISIYSSNLEEFYKVRMAEHKADLSEAIHNGEQEKAQAALQTIEEINTEVNRQLEIRVRIFENMILPELKRKHIILYQNSNMLPEHQSFISSYFREEIFPYLSPVPLSPGKLNYFLRDNRLYLTVRLHMKGVDKESPFYEQYFVMKLPYSKVPRFIELPQIGKDYYIAYIEDVIKANLYQMFPGYEVDCSYCIKISRDADIFTDDAVNTSELIEQVKKKIKKRKIGAVCRFVYDRCMPKDFLEYLMNAFHITSNDLVEGDKHLNMEDIKDLPNPNKSLKGVVKPAPLHLSCLNEHSSIFTYVEHQDLMLHYPYHSFDHFIHFLYEAVHDPQVREIKLTQYRVAENSAIVHSLIAASRNGKKVTVFVELKARFDEEHNLATAEMMKSAGINIIYSIPKLKVHAKVALVLKSKEAAQETGVMGYAYISTGNFNEKTASLYADCGLFTCNKEIVKDLMTLFQTFKGKKNPHFRKLLVARFNLIDELNQLVDKEIALARSGKKGRIILKMNALQDAVMISKLYEASEAGVEIDLIVRGICCLIPNQPYSANIRVIRIVDTFLEHARIWYFGNDGVPKVFMGSPDWMKRNLYRRIEAVVPVLDARLKQELIDMLSIQLSDRVKSCMVDEHLINHFRKARRSKSKVRAQYTFYDYLQRKDAGETYYLPEGVSIV